VNYKGICPHNVLSQFPANGDDIPSIEELRWLLDIVVFLTIIIMRAEEVGRHVFQKLLSVPYLRCRSAKWLFRISLYKCRGTR
jgi:hypothetical protein